MLKFIVRRLIMLAPILLGLSLVMAFFLHLLPGTPCANILGERATAAQLQKCEHNLGYDRPPIVQWADYVVNAVQLDFGTSFSGARLPVLDAFLQRFPATIELTLAAMLFAVGVGIPLGIAAAKRRQSLLDGAATVVSLIGISIPIFFLGLILVYVFGVWLHWLPAGGRFDLREFDFKGAGTNFLLWESLVIDRDPAKFLDVVGHLILPGITLGTIPLAFVMRITRSAVIEVLNEDYVRTARAKGLSARRIDSRHVLRNALLPVVTVIGLQSGLLLGGAVLTETVYSWGGVGTWLFTAAVDKDYAVIQSGTLLLASVFVLVNLAVDVSYAFLNPRIRYA
ncbi:MAG: peptide ABC transporter permease [Chloroflexi bacterium GWC2_73_18]|nr:MAG: peptide ABC transporter permease [Chloroflexi bacterium GWC2_73_18]